jgi:PQQ-dependent catabolism-associated CXXCW motif protein
MLIASLGTALFSQAASMVGEPALFSAEGYRQAHYRSPTPETVEGARTLDTTALQAHLAEQPNTVLIDVYRRQWLFGQFIEDEAHANLPGSIWLANTGDGHLQPPWAAYLQDNLARLSKGYADWPLVFYCRSDCWLGWNAVKRAHAMGYTNLYWYRDGIDAWEQAGLPLVPATPEPILETGQTPARHAPPISQQ